MPQPYIDTNGATAYREATGDGTFANPYIPRFSLNGISGTITLPTGASTSALQTITNTSLANLDTKLPSNLTVTSTRLLVDGSGVTQPVSLLSESGFLSFRNTALSSTPVAVKTSSGLLMGWNFINVNTSTVYVKLYNSTVANTTVGTSTPAFTLAVPGGSASAPGVFFKDCTLIPQEVFNTAITIACVTGLADNSTTAPTTAIHVSVRYK